MARKSARANAQKRARKRAPKTPFPFLKLAGEERNAIYRILLDDLTTPTNTFDVWSEKLPKYPELATYAALVRVCKVISVEARTIFEQEYLPNMPLYFNDLRTLWTFATGPLAVELANTDARYILRAPIAKKCLLGTEGAKAIVGHKNSVSCKDLPYEVWTTMEKVLREGLQGVEARNWPFKNGAAIEAKASGEQVFFTIRVPLQRRVPTHPTLKYHSYSTIGTIDGKTTSTIEGKIQDLVLAEAWHTQADAIELIRTMESWDATLCHGQREGWLFDRQAGARDFREMYDEFGWTEWEGWGE